MPGERHFVLVHGSFHGAWCWYKVVALLQSGGHKVTALDLSASGVNSKQVGEVRSNLDYSQPLLDFMEALTVDERVILVAHSYGGVSITLAMELFPEKISVAVFATATMPGPNLPLSSIRAEFERTVDSMDSKFVFDDGADNPPTSLIVGPNSMASWFYQLSPPQVDEEVKLVQTGGMGLLLSGMVTEVVEWKEGIDDEYCPALSILVRCKDLVLAQLLVRPCPLPREEVTVSKEKYGSVRRVYIVSGKDLAVPEDVQRWMIKNNPTDEVKFIPDSDHMVMLSQPLELYSCLLDIASSYA